MVGSRTGEPLRGPAGPVPTPLRVRPGPVPRAIDWIAMHCFALSGWSLLGLVASCSVFVALMAQQMSYDDSSGSTGSATSESAYWTILVVGVVSLVAAVAGATGGVVALVRRRAIRNHRGLGRPIGALVLSAPGVAAVVLIVVAYVVYLAGR